MRALVKCFELLDKSDFPKKKKRQTTTSEPMQFSFVHGEMTSFTVKDLEPTVCIVWSYNDKSLSLKQRSAGLRHAERR